MKVLLVILFSMVILIVAFIAFQGNVLTGYVIQVNKESFARTSDQTEITFLQNPVKRATTLQAKIIPGVRGVDKRMELYRIVDGEQRFIKSYVFCSWSNCGRARMYPIYISKAYNPGTYVLVVHDKAYGGTNGYFEVIS